MTFHIKRTDQAFGIIQEAVTLPWSKSMSNRVLAVNALCHIKDGRIDPEWCRRLGAGLEGINPQSPFICDDTQAMLNWLSDEELFNDQSVNRKSSNWKHFGTARAKPCSHELCRTDARSKSRGQTCLGYALQEGGRRQSVVTKSTEGKSIDVGAAGTAMRFSAAILSMLRGTYVLTGSARMKERPIGVLVDALRSLGAKIDYLEKEGFPPIQITGIGEKILHSSLFTSLPLGGAGGGFSSLLTLPGSVSSQYVSALLMIGPLLPQGLTLTLTGEVVSRPYIDMTLGVMRHTGAEADWTDDHTIEVKPVPYNPLQGMAIENDWSAASYWYEVLALNGQPGSEIRLRNLWQGSMQGDAAVQEIFKHLGVETEHLLDDHDTVVLRATGKVCDRLDWDFVRTPDLAQTVVVTCCMLGVPFRFTGLQSLKIKETDRIVALQTELRKFGFEVGGDEKSMWWDGSLSSPLGGIRGGLDTYKDHRMAMSFAPCALKLGEIAINDPMVVTKSYPAYWEQLKKLGFSISE